MYEQHLTPGRRYIPSNRSNGWVTLDRSWAKSLGVTRDRGVYRIRHRELMRRLERADSRHGYLIGNLTVQGVTRPVTLGLKHLGSAIDRPGKPKVVLEATAEVDREDFGLVWDRLLETGGVLVGKDIELQIEPQAVTSAA